MAIASNRAGYLAREPPGLGELRPSAYFVVGDMRATYHATGDVTSGEPAVVGTLATP